MKSITDLNVKNYIKDLEKNVTELKFKLENSENLINQQDQKILELVRENEEKSKKINDIINDNEEKSNHIVKLSLYYDKYIKESSDKIIELQKTLDYQNNSLEESKNLFKKTKHEYNQISWFFLTITILSFIFAICDYLKLF